MKPSPNDDPNLALDAFMRRAAPLFAKTSAGWGRPAPRVNLPPTAAAGRAPTLDAAALARTTARVSALAAAQWQAVDHAARAPVPQPVLGEPDQANPRLLSQWRPGAWTGARRLLAPATTELLQTRQGPFVNSHAEQHLVLLWAPVRQRTPRLGRWPSHTFVCGANAQGLDEAVLAHVPEDEGLWWLPEDTGLVDWALACEIILRQRHLLRPFQVQALNALLAAHRHDADPATAGPGRGGYHRAPPAPNLRAR